MARNRYIVGLVFLTFFVMSLLTNILGPIVPDIITSFGVSLTAAALLPFSFFIAYGVMSIPAGFWVERFTEKPVMIAAFLAGTIGSLSFALVPYLPRRGRVIVCHGCGHGDAASCHQSAVASGGRRRALRIQFRIRTIDLWYRFLCQPANLLLSRGETWASLLPRAICCLRLSAGSLRPRSPGPRCTGSLPCSRC